MQGKTTNNEVEGGKQALFSTFTCFNIAEIIPMQEASWCFWDPSIFHGSLGLLLARQNEVTFVKSRRPIPLDITTRNVIHFLFDDYVLAFTKRFDPRVLKGAKIMFPSETHGSWVEWFALSHWIGLIGTCWPDMYTLLAHSKVMKWICQISIRHKNWFM